MSIISTFWEYTIISYFLFSWNLYFLSQFQTDDLSYLHKNKEWTDGCLTKYCLLNGDIIHHYVWPFIEASKTIQTRKKNIAPEYNVLLLLLSRFSRVRLFATPWTAAYQASPSMGFSRREHWSGLPFSSPMHESGKWKWSRSVMSDS